MSSCWKTRSMSDRRFTITMTGWHRYEQVLSGVAAAVAGPAGGCACAASPSAAQPGQTSVAAGPCAAGEAARPAACRSTSTPSERFFDVRRRAGQTWPCSAGSGSTAWRTELEARAPRTIAAGDGTRARRSPTCSSPGSIACRSSTGAMSRARLRVGSVLRGRRGRDASPTSTARPTTTSAGRTASTSSATTSTRTASTPASSASGASARCSAPITRSSTRTSAGSRRSPAWTKCRSTCRAPRRSCRPCGWRDSTPAARTSSASAARTTAGGTTCSRASAIRRPREPPTRSKDMDARPLQVLETPARHRLRAGQPDPGAASERRRAGRRHADRQQPPRRHRSRGLCGMARGAARGLHEAVDRPDLRRGLRRLSASPAAAPRSISACAPIS